MATIYLQHNVTRPLMPQAREAMAALLQEDPRVAGSLLADGRRIRLEVESARGRVARFVGAQPEEIVFTSGGAEASNLALKGVAFATRRRQAPQILVSATEQLSVLNPARTLGRLGFELREIPVGRDGLVDLDALRDMLGAGTLLVSVALANAETGTIQPISEIARLTHERGALLHTDASLAAGYMPVNVTEIGADLASFSAHMLGGPRGVGALWIRPDVRLATQIEGGIQESGRRGGSHNVAGIAGFAAACDAVAAAASEPERLDGLGRWLEEALLGDSQLAPVSLNGHPASRLRALVNLSFAGIDGEALLVKLAAQGIAASSGSVCVSEIGKPSHVLRAMGVPADQARGSLLAAIGPINTLDEIRRVAACIPEAVASLRRLSPLDAGA